MLPRSTANDVDQAVDGADAVTGLDFGHRRERHPCIRLCIVAEASGSNNIAWAPTPKKVDIAPDHTCSGGDSK